MLYIALPFGVRGIVEASSKEEASSKFYDSTGCRPSRTVGPFNSEAEATFWLCLSPDSQEKALKEKNR